MNLAFLLRVHCNELSTLIPTAFFLSQVSKKTHTALKKYQRKWRCLHFKQLKMHNQILWFIQTMKYTPHQLCRMVAALIAIHCDYLIRFIKPKNALNTLFDTAPHDPEPRCCCGDALRYVYRSAWPHFDLKSDMIGVMVFSKTLSTVIPHFETVCIKTTMDRRGRVARHNGAMFFYWRLTESARNHSGARTVCVGLLPYASICRREILARTVMDAYTYHSINKLIVVNAPTSVMSTPHIYPLLCKGITCAYGLEDALSVFRADPSNLVI